MDDLGSVEGFSQCLQSMGHGREKQTWGSNIFFFLLVWLHWVSVAGLGLSLVVVNGSTRPCGAWASHYVASLVAELRL